MAKSGVLLYECNVSSGAEAAGKAGRLSKELDASYQRSIEDRAGILSSHMPMTFLRTRLMAQWLYLRTAVLVWLLTGVKVHIAPSLSCSPETAGASS